MENWVTGRVALEQLEQPIDLCIIPIKHMTRKCCSCPKRLANCNKGKRCFTCERKFTRRHLGLDKL